ncbi:hypothetical protein HOLleu_36469 [Holothuria leucospilota]|uniref:Secreted protein n=1 Tax=Holothuria leucospilota TaxID=206669 RepID=A0A9Q1BFP6_HOLLE|nr:hypothetical protein HOLleu_36469 [Holothuria leucospilota]
MIIIQMDSLKTIFLCFLLASLVLPTVVAQYPSAGNGYGRGGPESHTMKHYQLQFEAGGIDIFQQKRNGDYPRNEERETSGWSN